MCVCRFDEAGTFRLTLRVGVVNRSSNAFGYFLSLSPPHLRAVASGMTSASFRIDHSTQACYKFHDRRRCDQSGSERFVPKHVGKASRASIFDTLRSGSPPALRNRLP